MDKEKAEEAIEIVLTILLSAVIVGTAWCSYQADHWGGIQTFKLAASYTTGVQATEKALVADNRQAVDAAVVLNFANAVIEGNQRVVNFYLDHLRPEFVALLESWLATDPLHNPDAPPNPLVMPEYTEKIVFNYKADARNLREEELSRLSEAYEAKRISESYYFKTVLLAIVLFLGGILQKFQSLGIRVFLLIMSCAIALTIIFKLLMLYLGIT